MSGWIYRSITHNKEFRNNPSLPHSAVCSGVSMPKQLNCKEQPFQQRCFSHWTYTKWRSTQFQPYWPHKNSLEMGQCRAKATTHGVMCPCHLRAGRQRRADSEASWLASPASLASSDSWKTVSKTRGWDWSVLKSVGCPYRGPEFSSQHSYQVTPTSYSNLFWLLQTPGHICMPTNMHTHTHD